MTPMVVGIVPFGVAIGATVAASTIDPWAGLASAPVILAGAAQLATIQMLEAGSHAAVIIVSALLINLRILLYSASLAPWFRGERLRTRLVLAITVIDQTHLVCTPRFEEGDLDRRERVAYYTGASAWLLTAWIGSQTTAIVLGAELPAAARLDMAAPFALLGLLAKSVGTRSSAMAAVVGTLVVTAGAGLPLHSATLAATLVGIGAALASDARMHRQVRVLEASSDDEGLAATRTEVEA